jgi:hypothetical protein
MDSVVVHQQPSYNQFPMEGAFVGTGSSSPSCIAVCSGFTLQGLKYPNGCHKWVLEG